MRSEHNNILAKPSQDYNFSEKNGNFTVNTQREHFTFQHLF